MSCCYIDFSKPDPYLFDGVIVTKDQTFYVNKMTMSRNCEFFNGLFFGAFQTKEVCLHDINKEHFQVFLEAIHGAVFLNADRVTGIAILSKKWECHNLLEECVTFLLEDVPPRILVPRLTMLEVGSVLESEEIMNNALARIKSPRDLSHTVPDDVSNLDPEVLTLFFQKAMDFHRPPSPPTPITTTPQERMHAIFEYIGEADDEEGPRPSTGHFHLNPEYDGPIDYVHLVPKPTGLQSWRLVQMLHPYLPGKLRRVIEAIDRKDEIFERLENEKNRKNLEEIPVEEPKEPKEPKKEPEKVPFPNLFLFDGSDANLHDVVLIVDGQEFFVSKKMLALHSSTFHMMFFGNFIESKMETVPLHGVTSDEFQLFLECIHGKVNCLNDENIEIVLQLADMWDAHNALRKCRKFLVKKSHLPGYEKLHLGIKYDRDYTSYLLSQVYHPSEARDLEPRDGTSLPEEITQFLDKRIYAIRNSDPAPRY